MDCLKIIYISSYPARPRRITVNNNNSNSNSNDYNNDDDDDDDGLQQRHHP